MRSRLREQKTNGNLLTRCLSAIARKRAGTSYTTRQGGWSDSIRRPVDQAVVLPDGADATGWYVSLSRARDSMHVYTRDKAALRQSVMYPGERKSVWEVIQALRTSEPQSRNRMMPDL